MIATVTPAKKTFWQLEAARGAAAFYIALGHLIGDQQGIAPGVRLALSFGQEAVILFFLISGFVIHWSSANKPELSFGDYLQARVLRIYPLLLLTLGVAGVIAYLHSSADPRFSWGTLLGNVFMLQDWGVIKPGVWVEPYAGVLVLWSLSYEWWFYLLYFPIARRIPAHMQSRIIAVLCGSQALVYFWQPNQLSRYLVYFSIWWVGVELARAFMNRTSLNLRTLSLPFGTVTFVFIILAAAVLRRHAAGGVLHPGTHPMLELRHFFAAMVIMALALLWHRWNWVGFARIAKPFTLIAPWSYALYLLHEPVGLHSGWFDFVINPYLKAMVSLLLVCILAWISERYLQTWCRRLFNR